MPTAASNPEEPYISLVVATRNDDHGGNLLGRTQIFLHGWLTQAKRYNIASELIFVEWNPPADRPPLLEALRWPADFGPCSVRFIEVPTGIHGRYRHGNGLPLYQMIGKNVGIRRARGRFVLATNIDIVFSNELIEFIASGQLQTNCMYRVDRHDIEAAIPVWAPLETQLKYCEEHQLRVHAKWGSCAVDPQGQPTASTEDIVDGSSVRLGTGWHVREGDAASGFYRWGMARAQVHIDPPAGAAPGEDAAVEIDIEPNPYLPSIPLRLQ